MTINLKTTRGSILRCVLTAMTMVCLVACGSKPEAGPKPKPPWPDSPTPPSQGNPQTTVPDGNAALTPPLGRKTDVALTALADVRVLVTIEGQNDIWKKIRKGERLVIPKIGKMSIVYTSGKNLSIEVGGRIIKPHGGNENVGFLALD